MPAAMSVATERVGEQDAGVASAAVNTMQQVGGSIGTALLNTLAASAGSAYLAHHTGKLVQAQAALHSYSTAYWWSAGFFAVGALLAAFMYRGGRPAPADPNAPAAIHM
jgi:Na+/melibiose symporter-like transporter